MCVCVCECVCVPVAVSIFSSGWREGAILATAASFSLASIVTEGGGGGGGRIEGREEEG